MIGVSKPVSASFLKPLTVGKNQQAKLPKPNYPLESPPTASYKVSNAIVGWGAGFLELFNEIKKDIMSLFKKNK